MLLPLNTDENRYYFLENDKSDKIILFIGLNPSHGDNSLSQTDNTIERIRSLIGKEKYQGHGFIIINLTSQRTPSPKDLIKGIDRKNLEVIKDIINHYPLNKIVLFWGNGVQKHRFMENAIEIKRTIEEHNTEAEWYCVERNNSGLRHPKHFGRMGSIEELELLDKNTVNEYFNDLQAACNE